MLLSDVKQGIVSVISLAKNPRSAQLRLLGFTCGVALRVVRQAPLRGGALIEVRGRRHLIKRDLQMLVEVKKLDGEEVFLAGNPNVGKTSIYNLLTKSREHIGNFSGVTVSGKSKQIMHNGKPITITDIPGACSLSLAVAEEKTAVELLAGANKIIYIAEVGNLSCNLFMLLELLERGASVVLAINMVDELRGATLNSGLLASRLGIEVVEVSAKYNKGLDQLIPAVLRAKSVALPYKKRGIEVGADERYAFIDEFLNGVITRGNATKRAKHKSNEASEPKNTNPKNINPKYTNPKNTKHKDIKPKEIKPKDTKPDNTSKPKRQEPWGYAMDRFLLNKYLALPIFFACIALVFFVAFGRVGKVPLLGVFASDLLKAVISYATLPILNLLKSQPFFYALMEQGVIGGVGGVLAFLPQIVIVSFAINFMEDTGYMARVAFLTEGALCKVGLSGKAMFTLIMGFGCSATACTLSRNLPSCNMRCKTVMITPFFSCSARLPVYSAIIASFFGGGFVLIFGIYLLGVVVALLTAIVLNKFLPSESCSILPMPPYRLPSFRRIGSRLGSNVASFLVRVGTVIFSVNILVWILCNVDGTLMYTSSGSIMQSVASFISPIFLPLGFGNWQTVTALLCGVVAKEGVVSVMASLGVSVDSVASAVSMCVFVLLYLPCVSALSAIKREIGVKLTLITVGIELGLAYLLSLTCYQMLSFFL